MSVEYQRKRIRLKKQWAYIDAALRIVQLTQQSANQKYLLEAMMKSDSSTFDRLLNDDPTLVQCPIPVGYNHFNIYQIIVERATDTFIEHVFTKYILLIEQSTDGGKLLIPVACERGDANILRLVWKYFPCASLDGLTSSNQSCHYLLHDEPRQLIQREVEAYENEIPLACVIRNNRSDLLAILFQFSSFTLTHLTNQQKQQIFHLCLLAEHRQVSIDRYNIKWFKNQSLRPCGSIDCLRFLIEQAQFNPLTIDDVRLSPFTLLLEPIYLYLIQLHNKLLMDLEMKFSPRLLAALVDLIRKQMQLFLYLITDCCFQPSSNDLIRLNECHHYIEEIFHQQTNEYQYTQRMMFNINRLISDIDKRTNDRTTCLTLKEICRYQIRDYLRGEQYVLVQVEKNLNLSSSHKKYLKYLF